MENVWKKALSILQSEVNDQVYNAWFLPIQELSENDSSITLSVPNKFFENWIKEKYISLIKNSVQQAAGKELAIKFGVADTTLPSAPPANAQSQNKPLSDTKEKDQAGNWLKSVFAGSRPLPENPYRDFGLNLNYTFDNFVVGSSNRFAHAASLAVCEKLAKVYNPLFLHGGVGLGKTHLMQAMGHETLKIHPKAKILYISSEEFTNQLINAIRTKSTPRFRSMCRNVDILLIDDIQFIAGKESTQEEFFHTFNSLHDAHKQIVICSDRSPKEIHDLEERLVSRFVWGLIADIQPPDFETRIAIMEKKSELASARVPKEVLYFLAEHIKTNIREMEGALIRVVAYATLTGKDISVDLAREVLRGMINDEEKKITVDQIQRIVAGFYGISESDMKTKKRTRAVAYPRQMAMYMSRELTDHSLPDIGRFFGGRDHTTVLHACEKINRELEEKGKTLRDVEKLVRMLKR